MTHFTTNRSVRMRAACLIACLAVLFTSTASFAQTRPDLGTAATYAVFTSAGAITVITGDTAVLAGGLGYNTGSLEGFPPSTATFINQANAATAIAASNLSTAYTANCLTCGTVLGTTITNVTLVPGDYSTGAASTTGGNITFNAQGDSAAIFIVNIGSGNGTGSLSVASGTHMLLENNARAGNIYWFVGGAVTIHDSATFTGTIVAGGAIIFLGQSTLTGRALTTAGQIALAANHMSISNDTGQAGTNNLTVTKPASGDSILSGTLHDTIKWTGTGIALGKTIQYSLDSGVTWTTIATIDTASFAYLWNVPDTTSTKAFVRVTDSNSLRGVSGVFKIIANKIIVVAPALSALIAEGTLHDTIKWTGSSLTPIKTFAYSLDSGATWTTIGKDTTSGFTYLWNVPDTVSARAMIRITDTNGITGKSGMFTIGSNKIIVITPALAALITEGTKNYQITWSGAGLTPIKTFAYSLDSGATWTTIGKDTTNSFTYSWNVPDTVSARAMIRITDTNGVTGKSGMFTIRSSKITVITPALAALITEGAKNYQITWSGAGLTPIKTFALSLDSGATWTTIGKDTTNSFAYSWNVPDTASTRAMIRITDTNGITGMSGVFTIRSSGITVTRPIFGQIIAGGTQNFQINWTGTGITTLKTFALSVDGGATWSTIGTLSSNAFVYFWNVPDTSTTEAIIRITDTNGLSGESGEFAIQSTKIIVVVHPTLGEVVASGLQDFQITWTGTGLTAPDTLALSLDGGQTWSTIGTVTNGAFTYSWNVPNITSTDAIIRVTDADGITGESGVFSIKSNVGSIVILHPAAKEAIAGGFPNYQITFTATGNVTEEKTLEYSLDGGLNWTLIGVMNSDAESYSWDEVPNIATTQALIRIRDSNGVTGISGLFTITLTTNPSPGSINSVTLSGLDVNRNIDNSKTLGISWTFTPSIGTSVIVEYSLDYLVTWDTIATVPVTGIGGPELPNSTTWQTTATGYYNPVFIRVVSSEGMKRLATEFSIGALASVASDAAMNGYSVSNYPNPVTEQTTTIDFVLPVRSDVTLIVSDNLGRQISETSQTFDAGEHTIPFNTAQLADGIYTYTLVAGSTRLNGRMNVIR